MPDKLLLLKAAGRLRLTKTWCADGTLRDYDRAKHFEWTVREVEGLDGLAALLEKLQSRPHWAMVRGFYGGEDAVIRRTLDNIKDQALHAVMLDVDSFEPVLCDWREDPEGACREYVSTLPPEWRQAGFCWALSSSAGHPTKRGLRAHLWFWLEDALTSAQLKAWAVRTKLAADVALFNPVQLHYTAAPVIEPAGAEQGWQGPRFGAVAGGAVALDVDVASLEAELHDKRRELIEAGDDPVVPWLAEHWDVKSVDAQGRVLVACPWEGEHGSGAGGDSSSAYLPEGQGGAARGYSCLHAACAGRRDVFSFLKAVGYDKVAEDFEDVEAEADAGSELLDNRRGLLGTMLESVNDATDVVDMEGIVGLRIRGNAALTQTDREVLAQAMVRKLKSLQQPVGLSTARLWCKFNKLAQAELERNPLGSIPPTFENLTELLKVAGASVRYNVMNKRAEILWPDATSTSDNALTNSMTRLQNACMRGGINAIGAGVLGPMVTTLADGNLYSPVVAWLDGVKWDGIDRVGELADTLSLVPSLGLDEQVAPTRGHWCRELVGLWLRQALRAAQSAKGEAMQGVLVLQGEQYMGKSTWLKRLCPLPGAFLGEYGLNVADKDSKLTALRHWIVELGELDATFKKADISALKSFLTTPLDNIRRPYAPDDSVMPRRTVFCASVNPTEFLADPTGSRRFWCLRVGKVDLDAQRVIGMRQLWAQVRDELADGAPWQPSRGLVQRIQKYNTQFERRDEWADWVAEALDWSLPATCWRKATARALSIEAGARGGMGAAAKIKAVLERIVGDPLIGDRGVKYFLVPPLKGLGDLA